MTIVDGLTEAHNKRYLTDFLERELARAIRYQRPLSLVMFDIDHFKAINDSHGHLTGDHVLRELARRLRSRIRKEELLARYGGEEFVVVLPEAGHQGAMQFAEQLRELVEGEPFEFEGDVISITVSVGVSTMLGESIDMREFLRRVDENLYRAKHAGRNCVVG
jgi:diguanylate cyclase (GGDEF)-like protein